MTALALFETDRLMLSGWNMEQLPDLVRLHGDPDIAKYLSLSGAAWSEAQAAESLQHWIELFGSRRMGKLRVTRKADGVLLGRAGFGIYPPTGEAEIGYALFAEHHGQGYATEAAVGLRDWFFAETLHDHFIGFADTRNAASLAVLARIGMVATHIETEPNGLTCQFHIYNRPEIND